MYIQCIVFEFNHFKLQSIDRSSSVNRFQYENNPCVPNSIWNWIIFKLYVSPTPSKKREKKISKEHHKFHPFDCTMCLCMMHVYLYKCTWYWWYIKATASSSCCFQWWWMIKCGGSCCCHCIGIVWWGSFVTCPIRIHGFWCTTLKVL